jgi:hypothetical protein
MADEAIKEAIIKALEKEYFLIPKHNWILFLGGLVGFMFLATYGSYQTALQAAAKVVSDTGAKATIVAIREHGEEAKKSRAVVDNLATDMKNGNLKKEIIKSLMSNPAFLMVKS